MKRIEIQNFNTKKFIYLSENVNEFKAVYNELIYFKKGVKYTMKLVSNLINNQYYINYLLMEDFNINLISIEDFSYGKKTYKNLESA